MKILKVFLIGIVIIIAIPMVAALFISNNYEVTREVVINKPVSEVFAFVKQLKNQDQYSVWASIDPNSKLTYTGTDGTVGFISAWDSDHPDVGKGEQEITAIMEGQRIDYELRFIEPYMSTSPAFMSTTQEGANSTKVAWGFKGHMNYPMNLLIVLMDLEETIGKDLDTGLQNLKVIMEAS